MKQRNAMIIIRDAVAAISLISGFVFFWLSIQRPELVFSLSPVHTQLASSTAASQLQVAWNGDKISENIWISRVMLANTGKKEVRQQDILKPIRLVWPESCRVLRVLTKGSHDIVSPVVGPIESDGTEIKFNILEQNDNIVLEILYSASTPTNFEIKGVIVGQRYIVNRSVEMRVKTPKDQLKERSGPIAALLLLGVLLFIASAMIYYWEIVPQKKLNAPVKFLWVLFSTMLTGAVFCFCYAGFLYDKMKFLFA